MADRPKLREDDHRWLEDVEGDEALAKVRDWNARTLTELRADPRFEALQATALAIVNATDKIPYGSLRGRQVRNFWQDAEAVRGSLRNTSLDDYLSDAPTWTTDLSIDELAEQEGQNWVYKGATSLPPAYDRSLLALSVGGKDAAVRREWSFEDRAFVAGGFMLPEAKAGAAWRDIDTLLVATDWGDGSMTESGYPFVAKWVRRGAPMEAATEVFRGAATDVGVWPDRLDGPHGPLMMAVQRLTFFETQVWYLPPDGEAVALPLPLKASVVDVFEDRLVFMIDDAWTAPDGQTYGSGSLLAMALGPALAGNVRELEVIFRPDARTAIQAAARTRSRLLVSTLENVVGVVYAYRLDGGAWVRDRLDIPDDVSAQVQFATRDSDLAFIGYESYLRPDTLAVVDVSTGRRRGAKALPPRFDAKRLTVEQRTATSRDGTAVPYFLIRPVDAPLNGALPTVLYGYGGFQVSLNPTYAPLTGKLWLERGGAYVVANIRGGGEFGPDWHQAGLKTQRQRIYDDFVAVAEDLIRSNVTSPRRLGIMGGSNGGLLMGVMYNQRPELWNAVVCQVPLLDMLRYHLLLAGASWVGEYGHPDHPEERAFLETISPYHNVDPNRDHPEIFFVTSTKDDRVHPGHARKMAARLEQMGKPFLYYENIDGGHSAAANLAETAKRVALEYTYLSRKLMD